MADIIDQLEVNYHVYEVCDSSARADIAIINDKFDDYVTKAELDDYATKEDLDDYATVTALNTAITTTAAIEPTNNGVLFTNLTHILLVISTLTLSVSSFPATSVTVTLIV